MKLTRWFSSVASSALVKTASGGEMLGSGSDDGRFVSGDDGAVGMAHQVDVQVEGAGIAVVGSHHWGGVGNRGNSSVGEVGRGVGQVGSSMVASAGSKVVSTGGSNCGFIGRDNGTIGVGNKCSVQVEGSTVAVGNSKTSVGNGRPGVGNGNTNMATAGSKVVSTSCSNGRLINRNNSSVGMADKGGVQVERSRIAVGNNWSSVGKNRASMGNNRSNTVGGSKCSEVLSTGCGNCRFVNGNHCTIGVTNLNRAVLVASYMVILVKVLVVPSAIKV